MFVRAAAPALFTQIVAAALLAAPAAQAADETAFTPAAPIVYDWAGLYAGASVGASFDAFDTLYGAPAIGTDIKSNGFTGGALAGVNFQNGAFVYGAEADINFKLGDDAAVVAGVPLTAKSDWFSTLRGRAGYAFDRYMLYGTGGLAFGDVSLSTPGASVSDTTVGWTLGAGLEAALTDNFTLRGEYLYTDLGKVEGSLAGTPFSTEFDSHTVRAGVTYKFK